MKIAITAPPWIAIPPAGYGGIERVVYNLVEGLHKKGHEVTLYATGDSQTSCKLDYYYEKALGNHLNLKLNPYLLLDHIYHFYKNASNKYDIIHDNMNEISLYFADYVTTPCVYTLHGPLVPTTQDLFEEYGTLKSIIKTLTDFKDHPFVSISNNQRKPLPQLNYISTVYNSIILPDFEFNEVGGDTMVWLGRVNYTKGLDIGVEVAKQLKKKLVISAYIDIGDKPYFDEKIAPSLKEEFLEQRAETNGVKDKSAFIGNAKLFLFPIRWDEPFGIVMIEAMAVGTPVVSFALGAAPEVVKDGETGFLVNFSPDDIRGDFIIKKTGMEGLCEAVERMYSMPEAEYKQMRKNCREHVEKNFSVEKMVDEYEKVYEQILSNR